MPRNWEGEVSLDVHNESTQTSPFQSLGLMHLISMEMICFTKSVGKVKISGWPCGSFQKRLAFFADCRKTLHALPSSGMRCLTVFGQPSLWTSSPVWNSLAPNCCSDQNWEPLDDSQITPQSNSGLSFVISSHYTLAYFSFSFWTSVMNPLTNIRVTDAEVFQLSVSFCWTPLGCTSLSVFHFNVIS